MRKRNRVYRIVRISSRHRSKLLIMQQLLCWIANCYALPASVNFHRNEGEEHDGLPEVQRIDDAGTFLGFLFGVLCVEVYQLRRGHR